MSRQSRRQKDDGDKELLRQIAEDQRAMDLRAYEILGHLHRTLLAAPPFKLHDGTEVGFSELQNPTFTKEGELMSTFDVSLPNGAFVEFSLTKTGHGRPVPRYSDLIKEQNREKKRDR